MDGYISTANAKYDFETPEEAKKLAPNENDFWKSIAEREGSKVSPKKICNLCGIEIKSSMFIALQA